MFSRQSIRMASKLVSVHSSQAPPAAASYSHAIKANGFIYVSGQVPFTPAGQLVDGDFQARAKQVIENVGGILNDANSDFKHIVKVNVFLTNMGDFAKFNEIYSQYFNEHKPARSCVAVRELPLGVDVEMEVVAVEKD